MKPKHYLFAALAMTPGIIACSSQKKTAQDVSEPETTTVLTGIPHASHPVNAMPRASAFRMSGDYADNVAITLNPDGSLAYYPAPSDITDASRPVDLGNGWWLNRQGISDCSVFTRYTFEEYSRLRSVPTAEELKSAIIPGAEVTSMQELPVPASEAMQQLDSLRRYVSEFHRKPSILRPKR